MAKNKKPDPPKGFPYTDELIGFVLLALAAMIFLALISYAPFDPSFNTSSTGRPDNLLGAFGAGLAELLRTVFGLSSYLLPAILLWSAILLLARRRWRIGTLQIIGFVLLIVSLCGLFEIDRTGQTDPVFKGGIIGELVGGSLHNALNTIGAHIVLLLFVIASVMMSLSVSLVSMLSRLTGGIAQALSRFGQEVVFRFRQLQRRRERQAKESVEEKPAKRTEPRISSGTKPPAPPKPVPKPTPKPAPEPEPEPAPVKATPQPLADGAGADVPHDENVTVRERADKEAAPVKSAGHQFKFNDFTGEYELPPTALLEAPPEVDKALDRETLLRNSEILVDKLAHFYVEGRVVEVRPGPIVTMYEFEPAPGVKVSKVAGLEKDLTLALKAHRIRIVAPLPDRGTIGIEVPNKDRETVFLREIFESPEFTESDAKIPLVIGKDIFGAPYVTDLADMPHLLVAGTTGSGKSVFLNCVVLSLLYKYSPEKVRLLMVDPKMLEFQIYDGIPHLLLPVVTNVQKSSAVLRQAVDEMERRYRLMAEMGVRDLEGYNRKIRKKNENPEMKKHYEIGEDGTEMVTEEPVYLQEFPYIVVIIDEFADLMMVAPKDVLEPVQRLAQMARAAGIHLILATQRPSKDVITGDIKANMAARITFQLRTKVDSRVILDSNGAESLLGKGDMLFLPSKNPRLGRGFTARSCGNGRSARLSNSVSRRADRRRSSRCLR